MENIQTEASFLSPYLEESQRQLTEEGQVVVWLRNFKPRVTRRLQPVGEVPGNWDVVVIKFGPLH